METGQPWALCTNTDGSFDCTCNTLTYGTCYLGELPCNATLASTRSLQITSHSSDPHAPKHLWNDGFVSTHIHADALIQFEEFPPVSMIGKATLFLSREPGLWPCPGQSLRAFRADFECCTAGAGLRRLELLDSVSELAFSIPEVSPRACLLRSRSVIQSIWDAVLLLQRLFVRQLAKK